MGRAFRRFSKAVMGPPAGRALVAFAAAALAGCAPSVRMEPPSADGPHIQDLELSPARTVAGCPVALRFRFDIAGADMVRAATGWSRTQGRSRSSGYAVLAIHRQALGDGSVGEASATLTPIAAGRYRYFVQVEDSAGRWSNVLEQEIWVNTSFSGGVPRCE